MKKNLFLIVSVILNLLLVVIISIYMFSPLLDLMIIQKTLPRFCAFVEKNNPTAYKNATLCHIDEQPVSQTQPTAPVPVAQTPTQPVATQPAPTQPTPTTPAIQNYIEVKEFGVELPIDPTFAAYKAVSGSDSGVLFYSITGQCEGGVISKLTGTPASRKGEFVPSADTKQFNGFFLVYQTPQAVSCDPKKYADTQQKIMQVVKNGFKNAVLITQ